MKIRDVNGCKLAEGDVVNIHFQNPVLTGKIIKIQEGGLEIPGKKFKTPVMMMVTIALPYMFPHQEQDVLVAGMYKGHDPDSEKVLDELMSKKESPDSTARPAIVPTIPFRQ